MKARMVKWLGGAVFLAAVLTIVRADPAAAGGVVGSDDPSTCTEEALDAALAGGGSVTFNCGAAPFTIAVTTTKVIDSDTSIDGGGRLTLDGGDSVQLLQVDDASLSLSNATLSHGYAADGGGAIAVGTGTVSATNCTFFANTASSENLDSRGGAIFSNGGAVRVTDCTFFGNRASALDLKRFTSGGAIDATGELSVTNTTFSDNDSDEGGAIRTATGPTRVSHSTFSGNHSDDGGAILVEADVFVTDSTFSDNVADKYDAGAIYIYSGSVTVANSQFLRNVAARGFGGGISFGGTLRVTDSRFSDNRAACGGAIEADGGSISVTNSTFANNRAIQEAAPEIECIGGGAIEITSGHAVITASNFSVNSADCDGIEECGGGAIAYGYGNLDASSLTVSGCAFAGNFVKTGLGGGAIYVDNTPVIVTNSTFYSNAVSNGANGGAIAVNAGFVEVPLLIATNSTFLQNDAGPTGTASALALNIAYGGGGNGAILQNTIVAGSRGTNCAGGTFVDGGHNLDDGTSCGFSSVTGSLSNTNPLLDPAGVADNGGPTQTVALLPGSPAINAGDDVFCAAVVGNVDQRDVLRPGFGSTHCSIGAYEYEPAERCCQCAGSCAAPVDDSCGECQAVAGSVCASGGLCLSATPTPTSTPTPAAATITVNSTADNTMADGACTLREAIANANAAADNTAGDCAAGTGHGDTIVFDLRLPATIHLTTMADLEIHADVAIDGPSAGNLALAGDNPHEFLTVHVANASVVFANLTFQGGLRINNDGVVTLAGCQLYDGGFDTQGTATLANCKVWNSPMSNTGSLTLSNCVVLHSVGTSGLFNDLGGVAVATDCTFAFNDSYTVGGGVDNVGTVTMTACTFSDNIAYSGAGLFNDGTATLTGCSFSGNDAGNGGGVSNGSSGTVTLDDCRLVGNVAGGSGSLTYGPTEGGGGGFYNEGTAILNRCLLSGNGAPTNAGGAINNNGEISVADCTLSANFSDYGGGAVFNDRDGTATLTRCTLAGNSVTYTYDRLGGGGISNFGMLTVTSCTISENSGGAGGGGVYNDFDATAVLANCTVSGNSADSGAGVYSSGVTTLINCTLSGNASGDSGGTLFVHCDPDFEPGTTTLTNTIVASSPGGQSCDGESIVDGGHNLNSDGTCGIGPATDPLLDPAGPRDNGGPTHTIALLPGSPAIDAGDAAACAAPPIDNLDQRGVVRPGRGSSTCSIGAYEFNPPEGCCQCPASCALSVNRSCGTCTLVDGASCREGVACAAYTPTPTPTATPVITGVCCQCPDQCAPPLDGESSPCGICIPVVNASCQGDFCVPYTPTGTSTDTPTVTPSSAPTATPTPTQTPLATPTSPPSCTGDCDGSGAVTVNELIVMVNLALGGDPGAHPCPGVDQWCRGPAVTIDCIIRGVNNALRDCSG